MDREKLKTAFEDISDKTIKAGDDLEESINWFKDNFKLKIAIWNKEIELKKAYEYLGKLFYENQKSGNSSDEYVEILHKIDSLIFDLSLLKGDTDIDSLANRENIYEITQNSDDESEICQNCGTKNSKMVLYCKNCNEEL